MKESGKNIEERGLPRPVGAEESDQLMLLDGDIHPAEGEKAAKRF
jgi:hypothetical protein